MYSCYNTILYPLSLLLSILSSILGQFTFKLERDTEINILNSFQSQVFLNKFDLTVCFGINQCNGGSQ